MKRLLLAIGLALGAAFAQAQGQPTVAVSGRVIDEQGLALPGVTITAASTALQGTRTAVSSANGDYIVPFLPPGDYTVTFTLGGFRERKDTLRVASGQSGVRLDV